MAGHFKFGLKKRIKHAVLKATRPYLGMFIESQFCVDIANFIVFNQIDGDYLEFGVWRGDWFADFYTNILRESKNYIKHARLYGHKIDESWIQRIRFFGFDSFEGLPSVKTRDTPIHFAKGVYSSPKQFFIWNIGRKGVDMDRVGIVEGWYSETLNELTKQRLGLKKAAAIFVDCDLYESAIPIFQFINGLIHNGTVLIIDDWFRYQGHPGKGIQRAFHEWAESNPQWVITEIARCLANRIAFVFSDRSSIVLHRM